MTLGLCMGLQLCSRLGQWGRRLEGRLICPSVSGFCIEDQRETTIISDSVNDVHIRFGRALPPKFSNLALAS